MTPPRLAERCLRLLAGRDEAPWIANDLTEEFVQVAERDGPRAARRWYWRQVCHSAGPLAVTAFRRLRARSHLHIRDSARAIVRSPGLSVLIVLTLALGIGANAAVFSMADAVWLRPLDYDRPDQLVSIWERTPTSARSSVAPGNFVDYRRLQAFDEIAAFTTVTVVAGLEIPEERSGERVSTNLFSMLGATPFAGRLFNPADGQPGAPPVVVIGHSFWSSRLSADPQAIGRSIDINRIPHEIVGVLSPDFVPLSSYSSASSFDVFLPLEEPGADAVRTDRDARVVGRLRSGVTVDVAQSQLAAMSHALAQAYPETNRDVTAHAAPLSADLSRTVRSTLHIVVGAVTLITLIGCVNVANLLLVWASVRRRDIAVRRALGASAFDVVMESVWRGAWYGVLGGAAGLLLAVWVIEALAAMAPPSVIPRALGVALNTRVIAAAGAIAILSGLAAAVVPTWRLLGLQVTPVLRESSASVSGGKRLLRWRGALLAVQVASAVALALGAGLLIRSVAQVDAVDLGFATDRVVTMQIRLPAMRYPDPQSRLRFFEDLEHRVKALPGVQSVTFANQFPMRGGWGGDIFAEAGAGPITGEADLQVVSAGYFATLGFDLQEGRGFTDADSASSPGVVIISRTFAERFFPGESPLGRIIRREPGAPPLQVIGVVGEVRRDGKFDPATPQVYFNARQTSLYAAQLSAVAVRTSDDPLQFLPGIRQAVSTLDSALVVGGVRTLDELLNASVSRLRFHTWLLALMAALALVLSLIGVYSVASHVVAYRARELGVRMALGATRTQVVVAAMASAARWTAAGMLAGCAIALAASRALASLLFETTTHDPATFAVVLTLTGLVALVAALVPARRAAAGDPVAILRGE